MPKMNFKKVVWSLIIYSINQLHHFLLFSTLITDIETLLLLT